MSRLSLISTRFLLRTTAALLLATAGASVAALNSQESALADRVINDGRQGRASVTIDPILSAVARAKATDMARRKYFAHTDPDGHGANFLVRQAGYSLPSGYSTAASGNNIESLAAGYSSVSSVWAGWMDSQDHKRHILGETSFFAEQTSLGVGFYEDSGAPYRYYWVILTAPPSGPRLSISSPAANATLTASSVTVTGTTSGTPVDRVEVRLENAHGNSSYVTASGKTSWSTTISGLAAGTNTLRVRSIDGSGGVILEATRAVRRVVLEDLNVSIAGSGFVSKGFAGITEREVGRAYLISAAPNPGWLFSHWSGGEYSAIPKFTFQMRAGLTLTANFVPNPFLTRKGAYNGLLSGSSVEHARAGFVKVIVGSTGVVSGKLLLGGATHAFTGTLNVNGDATITIPRGSLSPLTVTLSLDVDGSSERLSGTLSDGSFFATFDADYAWQPGGAPSAFAGRYTISLPAASANSTTPDGAGWAVLSVSSSGVASLAGKLADGAAIVAAATVSRDGEMPIFRALYSSLGSIAGSLQFRTTSVSDLDGSIYWHKPERPTTTRYPAAFSIETDIVGSRYTAPTAGRRVIDMAAVAGNATLTLEGGGLDSDLTQSVTVTSTHAVKPLAPVAKGFTAVIKTANGCFSGTFTDPAGNLVRRFEGVFLQKQNAGAGYFLGAELSGMVEFAPAQ